MSKFRLGAKFKEDAVMSVFSIRVEDIKLPKILIVKVSGSLDMKTSVEFEHA